MTANDARAAATIAPDTVLVRARELVLRLSDEDEVGIDLDGERLIAPRVAVAILDAFAAPRPVGEVLAAIASRGAEHWLEASTCVMQLMRSGVLVAPDQRDALGTRGWVKPTIHLQMLDDRARTGGFCEALRGIVKPEDVVIDIGTGTGVLATCAAMAGARHVYAVESSGIAEVAAQVFEANQLEQRITLVRDRSTRATLPELGSVLVTETIGNDPLDEQILEIVADAKRRLLAPGARIIPSELEIFGIAIDIPRSILERHVFTARKLEAYRAAYGVDFTPLAGHRLSASEPVMLEARDVAAWPLAPPVLLTSIDFTGDFDTVIAARNHVTVSRDTQHLGVLLAFRATLAPGIVLSTLPDESDPLSHWAHAVFPAFDRPTLRAGESVTIEYAYDRGTTTVRVFANDDDR